MNNNFYKGVKKEEIECSSNSRCHVPNTRLKLKKELNLGKKKEEVDTSSNDHEANPSSPVPEFEITIKKSYLAFLVREANE